MDPFIRFLLPFTDIKYFDNLFLDYLNDEPSIRNLYAFDDDPEGLRRRIETYHNPGLDRVLLKKVLSDQYLLSGIDEIPSMVNHNILSLENPDTFTITAGHQLNIFSGPLYVFYKLISAINLAEKLNLLFPLKHFVPIYWMATEDHDIEEISSFSLFGKNYKWESSWKGISGRMPLDGIEIIIKQLKDTFGESGHSEELLFLLSNAYLNSATLAEATRKWINSLFGKYGLVIIDGNDFLLKKSITNILTDEITNKSSFTIINKTIKEIEKKYHSQAKPREVNLFYIVDNFRYRITIEGDKFRILNTDLLLSADQIKNEIKSHPERFSPNVVLRPLYQESILPNIVFIGGPAEIAYWLELKELFDYHNLSMPVLFSRCSALILENNILKKLEKLSIKNSETFLSADELVKIFIQNKENEPLNFKSITENISDEFSRIGDVVLQIDPTLRAAVESENQKIVASLTSLEEKILRSQKKKNETEVNQVRKLKEKLFPSGKLQEREETFIPYYLNWGKKFLEMLKENLDPFEKKFIIIEEQDKKV